MSTWFRPDEGGFDPRGGAEAQPECPPVDSTASMSCVVLGPDVWLYEAEGDALRLWPGDRLVEPPGPACVFERFEERLSAVCRTDGAPETFVDRAEEWSPLGTDADLAPFVRRSESAAERAVSTPHGLVASDREMLIVWRPDQPVSRHAIDAEEVRIELLAPTTDGNVFVAMRALRPDNTRMALKCAALALGVLGAFVVRSAARKGKMRDVVMGAVAGPALVAIVTMLVLGAWVASLGGLR